MICCGAVKNRIITVYVTDQWCCGFRVHFHGVIMRSKSTGQHPNRLKTVALMMHNDFNIVWISYVEIFYHAC